MKHALAPRKRYRVALLLLVVFIGALIWVTLPPNEPAYEGKPLSYWLEQYRKPFRSGVVSEQVARDEEERYFKAKHEAKRALNKIGTNALPLFMEWICAKDAPFMDRIVLLARKQSWIRFRWNTSEDQRLLGLLGFVALGSNAAPAVPSLIKLLDSKDLYIQDEAATALGRIGPAAQDAVPFLIICVNSDKANDSYWAIEALGKICRRPELVVPVLIKHIEDPQIRPRQLHGAIEALANFGTNAQPAIPMIERLAKEPPSDIQHLAEEALKQIKPAAADAPQ